MVNVVSQGFKGALTRGKLGALTMEGIIEFKRLSHDLPIKSVHSRYRDQVTGIMSIKHKGPKL